MRVPLVTWRSAAVPTRPEPSATLHILCSASHLQYVFKFTCTISATTKYSSILCICTLRSADLPSLQVQLKYATKLDLKMGQGNILHNSKHRHVLQAQVLEGLAVHGLAKNCRVSPQEQRGANALERGSRGG